MYLIDSGSMNIPISARTIGTMPPMVNKICQPCVGTKVAAMTPGMAPPTGTNPTAIEASVRRYLRGADSLLMATMFGITPPMPRPASKRSQNSWSRLAAWAAHKVNTPNNRFEPINAALRP